MSTVAEQWLQLHSEFVEEACALEVPVGQVVSLRADEISEELFGFLGLQRLDLWVDEEPLESLVDVPSREASTTVSMVSTWRCTRLRTGRGNPPAERGLISPALTTAFVSTTVPCSMPST